MFAKLAQPVSRNSPWADRPAPGFYRMSDNSKQFKTTRRNPTFKSINVTSYTKSYLVPHIAVSQIFDTNKSVPSVVISTLKVTGVSQQSGPTPRLVQRWLPTVPPPPSLKKNALGKREGTSNLSDTPINKLRQSPRNLREKWGYMWSSTRLSESLSYV